jgi:hypothetical protein
MSAWARPEDRLKADQPRQSALTGFETRVAFVDDVDPATTAHNSAAFFTQLGRLQRVSDFHNPILGNT